METKILQKLWAAWLEENDSAKMNRLRKAIEVLEEPLDSPPKNMASGKDYAEKFSYLVSSGEKALFQKYIKEVQSNEDVKQDTIDWLLIAMNLTESDENFKSALITLKNLEEDKINLLKQLNRMKDQSAISKAINMLEEPVDFPPEDEDEIQRMFDESLNRLVIHNDNATKHDEGKPAFVFIPPLAELEVAKAMTHGEDKYGAWNYLKGFKATRLYSAARRHMHSYLIGEDIDKDSGNLHLAHAAAAIMMLLENHLRGVVIDDRPK